MSFLALTRTLSLSHPPIFRLASVNGWVLVTTPYVVEEVLRNLSELSPLASGEWVRLRQELVLMDDVLTLAWPAVFPVTKDRPVLFSALAWADALLTHDRGDFSTLLGSEFTDSRCSRLARFFSGKERPDV